MATTITMPQLGETVTEGTVERWLKKPGDAVEKYEAFLEVSTDKVNSEVPSPVTGKIRELLVQEGTTVAVGTPIAVIDDVEAASKSAPAATPPKAAETQEDRDTAPPKSRDAMAESANVEPVPGFNIPQLEVKSAAASSAAPAMVPPRSNGQREEAALRGVSPAVRRLAREHHIDVRNVRGSGANGRVTADDVLAAAKLVPSGSVAAPPIEAPRAPAKPGPGNTSTYADPIPGTTIHLSSMRRIIAERMVESKRTAPHAWSMIEVDVTNVWEWRKREKDRFERDTGVKLTLLPFFIRAVVESLAVFPLMNAKFLTEGPSIQVEKDVNIGIAIGLPANLVVPVIKHADKLSIKGIALAAGDLIERARKNKLSTDDLKEGTFTVNNTGANGSLASAPIINAGQAGIVTMETVVKRPMVQDDDSIAIRYMMNSCLSLDHRVVDGYVASGFLADLKKRLESMGPRGAL
jgi:2-oxoisovalerate dehydrogenase E2 component (dihydrolipoyl transacylase)